MAIASSAQGRPALVIEVPSAFIVGLEAAIAVLEASVDHGGLRNAGFKLAVMRYLRFPSIPPTVEQPSLANASRPDRGTTAADVARELVHLVTSNAELMHYRDVDPWFESDWADGPANSIATSRTAIARAVLEFITHRVAGADEMVAQEAAIELLLGAFERREIDDGTSNKCVPVGAPMRWGSHADDASGQNTSNWSLSYPIRSLEEAAASGRLPIVLATGPRLLSYADSLLLLRPCSRMLSVLPNEGDRRLQKALNEGKERIIM